MGWFHPDLKNPGGDMILMGLDRLTKVARLFCKNPYGGANTPPLLGLSHGIQENRSIRITLTFKRVPRWGPIEFCPLPQKEGASKSNPKFSDY